MIQLHPDGTLVFETVDDLLEYKSLLTKKLDTSDWLIEATDIETEADVSKKLFAVEMQLAQRESLSASNGPIREQLVHLVRSQALKEDELVAHWLELYSTHTYWENRKVKARDVDVSIYDAGNGTLQVWAATFTLPGSLKRKDGKVDEANRLKMEKSIEKTLASVAFFEE